MALTRVDTGLQSFPDFNRNQQLANAQIYIGVPGLDPAILANQYQAYVVQEDGTQVAVPQPIRTSAGGVPTYLGSPVQIGINEAAYSFKVLNSLGSQIYYIADSSQLANYPSEAGSVSYTPAGAGAVVTTVEDKLQQYVSVIDFGAIADYDTGTGAGTDNLAAFNLCLAYCRANDKAMYIPGGKYRLNGPTTDGTPVTIYGDGPTATFLYPVFSSPAFLFNFTVGDSRTSIRDMRVDGPANYSANESFFNCPLGYHLTFERLFLRNMNNTINCQNAFYTTAQRCRFQFVVNGPIFTLANGASIRDCSIQRFTGIGIRFNRGLSCVIDNFVAEFGVGGAAVGIRLDQTQGAIVRNYYTEGDMFTDIILAFGQGRACVNTLLESLWLNTSATRIIHCEGYKGLEVRNVVLQTPVATQLFDFTGTNFSTGPIYVSNVAQVDQNANGFLNDVRGLGQNLIPFGASSNLNFYTVLPQPQVGDSTQADLTNLSNHTARDASNRMPLLWRKPELTLAATPGGLTATSSTTTGVYGAESSGIVLDSKDYGCVKITIRGTHAHSGADTFVSSRFRLTNSTYGGDAVASGDTNTSGAPAVRDVTLYVNVQPGRNTITMAITRQQGAVGSNSFTVTDISVG